MHSGANLQELGVYLIFSCIRHEYCSDMAWMIFVQNPL